MKPDKLYQELKELAEKLGITVAEQNFRNTGIRVKSGFCKIKDQDHCIIDKHIKVNKKADVLAECINEHPHEDIYVVPAVREYLERFKPLKKEREEHTSETSD